MLVAADPSPGQGRQRGGEDWAVWGLQGGVSAHGMQAQGELVPRPSERAAPQALHEQHMELLH